MSRETQRIPASSSFISSRLSSLKLKSPKFDFTSFCRSMSLIEPFFSKTSSMVRDIGLGLHTLFNAGVKRRDYVRRGLCYGDGGSRLLEPLRESLIPVLHIRCHRRLDPFQGISKVLHRYTFGLDISP